MTEHGLNIQGGNWLGITERQMSGRVLSVLVAALVAVSMAIFGRGLTITGIFLNDTFVFFDGIDRLAHGQMPHTDFSTPVGALGYYMPYLGYLIMGGFAGAVEFGSLILAGFALVATSLLMHRRAGSGIALLMLATIAGIIIVPIVPGWRGTDTSHAMHYNRWCWGLLTALFVLALRPRARSLTATVTGPVAAAILLALLYIKISYFAVGLAFLVLLTAYPDQRRTEAGCAAVGTILAVLVIWLIQPGLVVGYFSDIGVALKSSDAALRSYGGIIGDNIRELALIALALAAGLFRSGLGWRDYLVVLFIAGSGVAILGQNYQFVHIVSLAAAFAVIATNSNDRTRFGSIAYLVILMAGFFWLVPYGKAWARTALLHVAPGDPTHYSTIADARFKGMYVLDRMHFKYRLPKQFDAAEIPAKDYLTGDDPVSGLTETQYLVALADAVRLVNDAGAADKPILTLDFTNAVPLLVRAPRVSGGYSWLHLGRNVSAQTLPDGAEMFAAFDYVIVPFGSLTEQKSKELRALYGPYLAESAQVVARSDHWILLQLNSGR